MYSCKVYPPPLHLEAKIDNENQLVIITNVMTKKQVVFALNDVLKLDPIDGDYNIPAYITRNIQ